MNWFRCVFKLRSFILVGLIATFTIVDAATDTELQRQLYQQAKQALKKNQQTRYLQLEKQLINYPLYPYLKYSYLKKRIHSVSNDEVSEFIQRYPDLPVIPDIRKNWLKVIAKKNQWQIFLDNYELQTDPVLQCHALRARIEKGVTEELLSDIREQWLTEKSLPNECDIAFKILENSHYMNDELVWQRIRLSMAKGNVRLASYLGKKLSPDFKHYSDLWIKFHNNPGKQLANLSLADDPYYREILIYGVERLARRNISEAIKHWWSIQTTYQFSEEQIALVNRHIAIQAVRKKHPDSLQLLDLIPTEYQNKELLLTRIKVALKFRQWKSLSKWLDGIPPDDESIKNPWYYWKARSLQKLGYPFEADRAFSEIANQRDYYGFLAADNLNLEYGFNHSPIKSTRSISNELHQLPAILRIQEFLKLDEQHSAVREWQWLIKQLDTEQLEQAALLASKWNWNDRVIVTLGYGKLYDDLILRFPLNYEKQLQWYSTKNKLDLSWVFALVRTESAFVEKAKSPAGALGLMQVMPATGRMTAKRLGWKTFNSNMLLQADKNIPIGSAYLKQMLHQFKGNLILATAAYNAGPNRVKKWLPDNGCVEPDIWIEQIPFTETRRYVKRILYYANIYDWRFSERVIPIRERMSVIGTSNIGATSALSCEAEIISMN